MKDLTMMSSESVTCYILGVSSVSGVNFAFMRGQDIQAKLVFHPTHHDMVHIISGMMDALGNVDKVMEVITRYASILKYSDALKAALKLICKWPRDLLEVLVSILVKYQNYQTADTDLKTLKKNNSKLMKGEKLIMPISVFKEVAKFPHEFLRANSESVLSGAVSVKSLVSDFMAAAVRRHKESLIEVSSGHQSIESLRINFPEKFTPDIIDKLPAQKKSSDERTIECYTKCVLENIKNDPEVGSIQLEFIDRKQDFVEIQSLFKQSKRPRVKEALESLVKSFEMGVTGPIGTERDVDPFRFDPSDELSTLEEAMKEEKDAASGSALTL